MGFFLRINTPDDDDGAAVALFRLDDFDGRMAGNLAPLILLFCGFAVDMAMVQNERLGDLLGWGPIVVCFCAVACGYNTVAVEMKSR